MRIILAMLSILMLLSASMTVSGYSEKLNIGPFTVKFNLSEQPTINISEPIKRIGYDEYRFQLKTGILRSRVIDVEIDDYENSTDVSKTNLMNSITNMIVSNKSYRLDMEEVTIGEIAGIRGKISESDSLKYQIAAFSPDGKDNKGNIIVFIKSFVSDAATDSFLHNFNITRVGRESLIGLNFVVRKSQ